MGFKYKIFEIIPGWINMEVEPNEQIQGFAPHIGGWLDSDVQHGEDCFYTPIFQTVLEGKVEEEHLDPGNAYELIIRKDFTTIKYIFEEDNPHMIPCTLPTKMLYEILQIWLKATREYREKKQANKE